MGSDFTGKYSTREMIRSLAQVYLGAGAVTAVRTLGGRERMRLMKADTCQSLSSEFHWPFTNMPERRIPCLAIQKI